MGQLEFSFPIDQKAVWEQCGAVWNLEVTIMLCQFTVKNFKSIRDEATFDMQAAAISEHEDWIIKDKDGVTSKHKDDGVIIRTVKGSAEKP